MILLILFVIFISFMVAIRFSFTVVRKDGRKLMRLPYAWQDQEMKFNQNILCQFSRGDRQYELYKR